MSTKRTVDHEAEMNKAMDDCLRYQRRAQRIDAKMQSLEYHPAVKRYFLLRGLLKRASEDVACAEQRAVAHLRAKREGGS